MRVATFLNWRSDPFRLITQARTARAVARNFPNAQVVTTIDMTSRLSRPNVDALMTEGIPAGRSVGARLTNAVRGVGGLARPIVLDEFARGIAENRYHRVDRDPEALDLGVRSPVAIPRDGEVDCKDTDVWIAADWASQRQIYPVRPLIMTYHPLADRLRGTPDAAAGFAKRMQYLEAAGVVCAPGASDLAVRRFGLERDRLVEHDLVHSRRGTGGRHVLVIADSSKSEEEVLEAFSGKSRDQDAPVRLTVALPLGGAVTDEPIRITEVVPGGRRKKWASHVAGDGLAYAATLLERADAVVTDGEVLEDAYAIARWVDEKRRVVIPAPAIATDLSAWSNLTALALPLAARARTAMAQLEAGL